MTIEKRLAEAHGAIGATLNISSVITTNGREYVISWIRGDQTCIVVAHSVELALRKAMDLDRSLANIQVDEMMIGE